MTADENLDIHKLRKEVLDLSRDMHSHCHATRWTVLQEASERQLLLLRNYAELAETLQEKSELRGDLLSIAASNNHISGLVQTHRSAVLNSLQRRKQGVAMKRLTREIGKYQ